MMRTTVSLPDDLATLLAREARRRETSVSDIVRRAVQSFLDASGGRRELPFAALGRSGRRHTARDAEKILTAEWGHARRR
ncbi:MAG: ribbon-helix-helix protein, CopG family [Acidobacteria bacterium]|nr:ribbon-helix-helix protein, CopG family [Acidobacteriota bacterium]